MRITRFSLVALALVLASDALFAQGRGGAVEWPVTHGDAQQTSWIRTDIFISPDAMSKPGFDLQWKTKLDNQARQMNSLATGVTVYGVTLFVPLSTITGSSNNVFAIDNDTGVPLWQRHFDAPLGPAATAACPGGITAAATRIAALAPAPLVAGRAAAAGGGGRGYSSTVFNPGEGVPQPAPRGGGAGRGAPPAPGAPPAAGAPAAAPGAPAPGAGPAGAPAPGGGRAGAPGAAAGGRGGAPAAAGVGIPGAPNGGGAGGGFGRPSGVVYAVSSDGVLHVLGLPSGKDIQKPAPFLPANVKSSDLIAVGETLYGATSGNCGGAPNGVWAIDLQDPNKPVTSWKTNGGGIVGSPSFAPDGTLLAAIGAGTGAAAGSYKNAIVALDPKTLQLKDWFTQPNAEFVSSPLVFKEGDKDIVTAATKDGRVLLLDASSLGGANHSTPLYASRRMVGTGGAIAGGALAMWQEAIPMPAATPAPGAPAAAAAAVQPGTRWLLMPVTGRLAADAQASASNGPTTNGAVVALKVMNDAGKISLAPGWVSRDLTSPVTPLVVNGVVFAASSGKPQTAAAGTRGTPAVLYALDGKTGKELWTSANTITSFMPGRSLWAGASQVYVNTFDGMVYAFGFAMERH